MSSDKLPMVLDRTMGKRRRIQQASTATAASVSEYTSAANVPLPCTRRYSEDMSPSSLPPIFSLG